MILDAPDLFPLIDPEHVPILDSRMMPFIEIRSVFVQINTFLAIFNSVSLLHDGSGDK